MVTMGEFMKLELIRPIEPVYKARMSIRHDEHTVVILPSMKRVTLPAKEAWKLLDELNNGGILC